MKRLMPFLALLAASAAADAVPLATLHRFNGWADKFLVTPADGLRDTYGSVGYGWKNAGPFDAIALVAVYHRFDSHRLARRYGDEIDLQALVRRGNTPGYLRFADYRVARQATDTRKLWLTLEWAI